jgi:hypothetical protein
MTMADDTHPTLVATRHVQIKQILSSTSLPPTAPDNGQVGCFPSDATVEDHTGKRLRMDEITIGSMVRVSHSIYEPIIFTFIMW